MERPSLGHPRLVTFYGLSVGLAGLAVLCYVLLSQQARPQWFAILAFASLSFLVQRLSFHLGTPASHSLSGVIDIAAVLALGPTGATSAALSGLTYLELKALHRRQLAARDLVEIPLFDAGLKAMMALLVAWLYGTLAGKPGNIWQGEPPLSFQITGWELLAILAVCLTWFILDHIGWGILDYLEGGIDRLRRFVRDAFPLSLLTELLPLPVSIVLAWCYTPLPWAFVLLALVIVAVALLAQRWAEGRLELTRRVAELTTVEQVGRAIAQAQLDVEALCRLLYEHVSHIADATIFSLGLFVGHDYIIKLWMQEGQREPERTFHLSPGVGLVTWMRDSHQPLLVRDFEKESESLPARPAYVSDRPPRSALFVPLMAGETVIGTMSVQSYQRDAYGQSDLRVLSAMANQAALAIQKAQLYAQVRKRAHQLETIGQVSRKVAATLEIEVLFQQAVDLIRESFGYYHVAIFTADREQQTVTYEASASAGAQNVTHDIEWGQGLIGWVAAHAQPVIANDVANDARYLCVQALDETRSEVVVPLLLEKELVGLLDVESDQLNAFGPDDQFILETLGDQVAIAIQEGRLYAAKQQQAWLATALLQVADTLNRLSDMDDVLTNIVRLTPMLTGVDRCGILLWDEETETFLPTQTYGLTPELGAQFEQMTFPVGAVRALDLIREDPSPMVVDAADDQDLIPRALLETFNIGQVILLPLLAQGDLIGIMLVDCVGEARASNEQTMPMLSGIANQAAMVVQSARLLQARQEEAYVSMALLQVAAAVSRSTPLTDALAAVVRITPLLVGVEACTLFLWDAATHSFLPYQQYGLPKETLTDFWQLRFAQHGPPASDLKSGRPYLTVEDTPELAAVASILAKSSLLILPVAIKGELVAIMSVDCSGPIRRFTQRRLGILTGIASQAAIAVENDRLLREAAEQARMKQELEVARRIQTSFLPEFCPDVPGWELAAIWRSAREVGGDFYDFIPILPSGAENQEERGQTGVVIADVADKGVPAALFMALSRTLLRTMAMSRRSPATAVAQANNLILADARAELFVTLFYAVLEPDSGDVTYVNAGHFPPFLVRAANGTTEELRTGGMAMGVLPDIEYVEHTTHLHPGDTLVLYTDGLIEASDSEGQMFRKDRLKEVIQAHRSVSAEELAKSIDDAVAAFVGDAPQSDDLTLVIIKRQT